MFKIGDTLVCKETNSVMLSANSITTGEEYVVTGLWDGGVHIVNDDGEEVGVCDYRFKLKEDIKVEKKECLFKEGQVVWDVVYGKGFVSSVEEDDFFPVKVEFDAGGFESYTLQGSFYERGTRTLYFSEPKIEAATEPVFEPTLKKGDVVVAVDKDGCSEILYVSEELERQVKNTQGTFFYKESFDFYRLGEKINFK